MYDRIPRNIPIDKYNRMMARIGKRRRRKQPYMLRAFERLKNYWFVEHLPNYYKNVLERNKIDAW